MAEYYPLLAKAVGSLPNSTPETRRVVYERARKALIGQLRTLHPPVPEEDIDRESVALDRAIERLETELAVAAPLGTETRAPPAVALAPPAPSPASAPAGAVSPLVPRKPIMPLRPRTPRPSAPSAARPAAAAAAAPAVEPAATTEAVPTAAIAPPVEHIPSAQTVDVPADESPVTEPPVARARVEPQRPIAPQPQTPRGPKRRMWIIPVGLGAVVLLVAVAAWKLRVKPETIARDSTPVTTQQPESGKIADRVGGKPAGGGTETSQKPPSEETPTTAPTTQPAAPTQTAQQQPSTPELPVAYRSALLVEAPDLPTKVQTFAGTVVWKLNNVNSGPSDTVGLSVEADVDLPDDKTKAVITFEKNSDPSLPASHTIKVRFIVEPGSYSGGVKQISVPQMRREGNSDGEPLAGVTVPVIQNSFLVGLSPGNAETANLRLLSDLPWLDIPMLLDSGKIAKLTFEKGPQGQRDMNEALAFWQKS